MTRLTGNYFAYDMLISYWAFWDLFEFGKTRFRLGWPWADLGSDEAYTLSIQKCVAGTPYTVGICVKYLSKDCNTLEVISTLKWG